MVNNMTYGRIGLSVEQNYSGSNLPTGYNLSACRASYDDMYTEGWVKFNEIYYLDHLQAEIVSK